MNDSPNLCEYLRTGSCAKQPTWRSRLLALLSVLMSPLPLYMIIRQQIDNGEPVKPATSFLVPFGVGTSVLMLSFVWARNSGNDKFPMSRSASNQLEALKETIKSKPWEYLLNMVRRAISRNTCSLEQAKGKPEGFAIYLANPRGCHVSIYSRSRIILDLIVATTIPSGVGSLTYLYDTIGFGTMPAGLIVFISLVMIIPFGYIAFGCAWIGAKSGFDWKLGALARRIRRECQNCNTEKASDCLEKLVDLTEGLLQDGDDSEKMIEDRKESIRVSIRESGFQPEV